MKKQELHDLIRQCINEVTYATKVDRSGLDNRVLFRFPVRLGNIVNDTFKPDLVLNITGNSVEDFIKNLKSELADMSDYEGKEYILDQKTESELRRNLTDMYINWVGNKNE